MNLLLTIASLLLIVSQSTAQDTLSEYSSPFTFEFSADICTNNNFDYEVSLVNNIDEPIKFINLSSAKLKIECEGRFIDQNDTLILKATQKLSLCLTPGNIPISPDSLLLTFKTDLITKPFDSLSIPINQFEFTTCDFWKSEHKIIKASKSRIDCIKLNFPNGGTETTISIYKSVHSKKALRQINYSLGLGENQSIVISKLDLGRYLIVLSSCHWNGRCWLTIN